MALVGAAVTLLFIRTRDSVAHRDAALAGEAQPVAA
jgi:hypothetical protein